MILNLRQSAHAYTMLDQFYPAPAHRFIDIIRFFCVTLGRQGIFLLKFCCAECAYKLIVITVSPYPRNVGYILPLSMCINEVILNLRSTSSQIHVHSINIPARAPIFHKCWQGEWINPCTMNTINFQLYR